MPNKASPEGKNTDPSPMTYEVHHMPSLEHLRARIASGAEDMNATDLRAAAVEAQIDVSDARTKEQLVTTVKQAVRGTDAPSA